ncbi:hypothetical protein GQ457_09G012680 [Hibiscus cannabinus]
MKKATITTAILLFLVVADASPFWRLRFLADESPTKDNTTATTPPSSQSPTKKLDPKPDSQSELNPDLLNKTNPVNRPPVDKKDPKPGKVVPPPQNGTDSGTNLSSPSNSTNVKPVKNNEEKKNNASSGDNSTSNSTNDKALKDKEETKKNTDTEKKPNSTGTEQADVSKEDGNKKKPNEEGIETQPGIAEKCDGVANRCNDSRSLTACIKGFEAGSKHWVVLVHNSGGKSLIVNVAGPSGESLVKGLKVPKHGTQKVNITLTISKTGELSLNAGNGDCVLHINPLASEVNPFLNLPSYDKLLTPVNGAYFLIATVLVFGGSWACCMFRKKRRHDGIPYQELEMGLPESMAAAAEVETAEGWDQGWDSDWDEDKAVKSPMGRHNVPNISANGLTTRSTNRDGWENDWDD